MFNRIYFFLFFCLSIHLFVQAESYESANIHYRLVNDAIDVVIVTHPKDTDTLDMCIEGIRENCRNVRRVIVVSSIKLTDEAEWFDETKYPFSLHDVLTAIGNGDTAKAERRFKHHWRPPGWYLQQLLKLYAPFVIPGISSNVLVVDADTIFMNPVEFLNESFGGLFCTSDLRAKSHYLKHAERLVPGYERVYPRVYSVCHHMLFQKPILQELFRIVEQHHQTTFWNAFCSCVDFEDNGGASEFEIYYNFALRTTKQVDLRKLKWKNSGSLSHLDQYKEDGYHFVSFHTYLRGKRKADPHLFRR